MNNNDGGLISMIGLFCVHIPRILYEPAYILSELQGGCLDI